MEQNPAPAELIAERAFSTVYAEILCIYNMYLNTFYEQIDDLWSSKCFFFFLKLYQLD